LTAQNPNIIFILADDMGVGDISALNKASKILNPQEILSLYNEDALLIQNPTVSKPPCIEAYPNPTQGKIQIKISQAKKASIKLQTCKERW